MLFLYRVVKNFSAPPKRDHWRHVLSSPAKLRETLESTSARSSGAGCSFWSESSHNHRRGQSYWLWWPLSICLLYQGQPLLPYFNFFSFVCVIM